MTAQETGKKKETARQKAATQEQTSAEREKAVEPGTKEEGGDPLMVFRF